MYVHAPSGNNFLGETVTAFALMGLLESLAVVIIDAERDFSGAGNKSRLPAT